MGVGINFNITVYIALVYIHYCYPIKKVIELVRRSPLHLFLIAIDFTSASVTTDMNTFSLIGFRKSRTFGLLLRIMLIMIFVSYKRFMLRV